MYIECIMSTIDCVYIYVNTFEHFALIYTVNLFVCVNKEFLISFDVMVILRCIL